MHGQRDGNGKEATFKQPSAITMDSKGNLFVTDNYVIRKIDANGNVTTYAGSNSFGHEDGGIGIAKFYQRIGGIVADSLGSLYVSDRKFIRKINSTGEVNTVCGANDNSVFSSILGICLVNNMLYVTDIGQIKKISLTGSVEVLTGDGSFNSIDGSITNAKVIPIAITSDISGNLIFTEFSFGHKIRIVTSSRVSTLQLQSMNFKFYGGVATDKEGNIFTVDGHSIVKLDILGKAEIIAGNEGGYQDGNNTDAKFFSPNGLYVDDSNNIYVCDSFNNRIRKISPIN